MLKQNTCSTTKVSLLLLLLMSAVVISCSGGSGSVTTSIIGNSNNGNVCISSSIITDLTWSTPTIDVDGRPLANSAIIGYRLYFGSSHSGAIVGSYVTTANVFSLDVQNVAKQINLAPNTYALFIAAMDTNANDIAFSASQCVVIIN